MDRRGGAWRCSSVGCSRAEVMLANLANLANLAKVVKVLKVLKVLNF
jgi:hypothetical protein